MKAVHLPQTFLAPVENPSAVAKEYKSFEAPIVRRKDSISDHSSDDEIDANSAGSLSASPSSTPPLSCAMSPPVDLAHDEPRSSDILSETGYVLDIIHDTRKVLPREDQQRIVRETTQNWIDHVNPGFLQYRKSVSTDYTSVEWHDTQADGEGDGSLFCDIQGREYIDCLGGYGIYNTGHRHPKVVDAVKAQLEKQALHSQELIDPLRTYLARITSKMCGGDLQYCFFTNSGTESVEACLKMAMLTTGRKLFISAVGGFHGKTLGSLGATSKACFRSPFLPLLNFQHVPFGDTEALRSAMQCAKFTGNEVAGVLLEPVQGEGGINVSPPGYLQAVRKLCDEHGAMMICDEVQSGMGRTGKWCAYQHWDVTPDLVALGKAFGGGVMPIGACVGTRKAWEKYMDNPFLHTSTFGGNPLACAAALACIHVIAEEGLCEQAREKGDYFMAGFRKIKEKYPKILSQVRGLGLMIGLEFPTNEIGYAISRGLFSRGVLVAGTLVNAKVVRIEPPLTISYEHLDIVLVKLEESCAEAMRQKELFA